MLTPVQIRLTDEGGKVLRWSIRRVPRAINVGLCRPARIVAGWEFVDHDGYVRFAEGNWLDLVARVKAVAGNYSLTLASELS